MRVTSKTIAQRFPLADLSALPNVDPGGGKPWGKICGAGELLVLGAVPDLVPATGGTITGDLFINPSGATIPELVPGTNLSVSNAAGGQVGIQMVGFGAAPQYYGARAQGTPTAPSALNFTGFNIFVFASAGYHSGGAWSTPQNFVQLLTAQPWTSTAQGTTFQISTTPNGTTTSIPRIIASQTNIELRGSSGVAIRNQDGTADANVAALGVTGTRAVTDGSYSTDLHGFQIGRDGNGVVYNFATAAATNRLNGTVHQYMQRMGGSANLQLVGSVGRLQFGAVVQAATGELVYTESVNQFDVCAANGLRVRNLANNAFATLQAGVGIFNGSITAGTNVAAINYAGAGVKLVGSSDIEFAPTNIDTASDVIVVRNAVGQLDVRGDSGLRVRNLANTVDAPLTASSATFSASPSPPNATIRMQCPDGALATRSINLVTDANREQCRIDLIKRTADLTRNGNIAFVTYSGNVETTALVIDSNVNTAYINYTTLSTTSSTGALVVSGGVGVGGTLSVGATLRLGTFTVGTLPSASANARARAFVTDSAAAFNSANLGATVIAGGTNLVPVWSNGTNWVIG